MSVSLDALAESQLIGGQPRTWLEQLRPATFRGIPFHVDTIEWTAGDSVVLREYPFQDLPTVFRMGAVAQELRFSAYVIGTDYHLQRDALMSALSGPGMLMHPTAGPMRVYVAGKFTVREAPTAEGGMARFDLTFVRADAQRFPVGVVSTSDAAAAQAEVAKAAAVDAFAAEWSVDGRAGWIKEGATARLGEALARLVGPLRSAASTVQGWSADINTAYRDAINALDTLTSAPRSLAGALGVLFSLPQDISAAAARDVQAAMQGLFDLPATMPRKPFEAVVMPAVGAGLVMYGTGVPGAAGEDSIGQQQINALAAAGDQLLGTLAVAAWVQATALVDLANVDDAMAMRAALHTEVTRLLAAGSAAPAAAVVPASSWHDALLVLHAVALADLQARGRDLVRLTTFTPESWQPVWCVSHRLYGSADFVDELLAANPHVEHPLLVPPGRPLRVARHD